MSRNNQPLKRVEKHERGSSGRTSAFGPALIVLALMANAARAASVEVDVTNVNSAAGHVWAALCPREKFLKDDCPYFASAPAREGETVINFADVAPGEYAVQAFHDDTDSRRVHQDPLGVPREGVGFSNNPFLHIHGPRFKDAAFTVGEGGARVQVKLLYLKGKRPSDIVPFGEAPPGPPAPP